MTLSGDVSSKKPGEIGDDLLPAVPDSRILIQTRTVLTGAGRDVQLHRRPADPDELLRRPGRARTRRRPRSRSRRTVAGRNNGWVILPRAVHVVRGHAGRWPSASARATGQWVTSEEGAAELEVGPAVRLTGCRRASTGCADDVRQTRRAPRFLGGSRDGRPTCRCRGRARAVRRARRARAQQPLRPRAPRRTARRPRPS